MAIEQRFRNISLISAISEKGNHWFSLVSGTNNAATFLHFMKQLVEEHEKHDPAWRSNYVIVMDNARIHHHKDVKAYVVKMKVPILYSGPASCASAPVERLFAHIKRGFGDKCTEAAQVRMTMSSGCRQRAMTETEIMKYIIEVAIPISSETIRKLFPSMLQNLKLYL